MRIHVCQGCAGDGGGLAAALDRALASDGIGVRTDAATCMSGCARPVSVAFRAPGKTAYLFGDLEPGDVAELVRFARVYDASVDGVLVDARPLGALRFKVLARIPG